MRCFLCIKNQFLLSRRIAPSQTAESSVQRDGNHVPMWGLQYLDDLHIQLPQQFHIRHNGDTKIVRNQPSDYLILLCLICNLRLCADFLK